MPRFIAFLRAINVGGHIVSMESLRGHFAALRLKDVETFIASGNVLFTSRTGDPAALERRIEKRLHDSLGYEVRTFIRSGEDLAAILHYCPYQESGLLTTALCVGFLAQAPGAIATRALMKHASEADRLHVHGREVYWLSSAGVSKSAISYSKMERALECRATFRGINTVKRLVGKYSFSTVI
ncbi:MAG: DUF1697 domain-containing protein [Gemmatimonadota bacterium]